MTRAGRRAALAALTGLALALASGCATRPTAEPGWISGKLALRVDATASEAAQSLSTDFDLRGDAQAGELRLSTPLGTVIALARWAPGRASLQTSDGEKPFADLDALAQETLGVAVPLRALPDWLHGQPWSGAPSTPEGRGVFEQLGWRIDVARYGEGWLEVSRAAAPAVRLRARLEKS
ncbi:MAG: outer membrane lipoprotein LolB [Burkholderiales bacterium]|nr:outer membrane lipoprotein LolB [Burkholderiales bacterium]MDE2456966.1 outer membrane lipoprotein LolB [Burkholderiales bacterium]